MKLPDKLTNLTPYIPAGDGYKIRLDANESYIGLPQNMLARIQRDIGAVDFNRYPDPSCRALREAAARVYNTPAAQIIPGNGSDELLSVIVNAFVPRGGKMLVMEPDFSMYTFYAALAECEVVRCPKDALLTIDPDGAISLAQREKPDLVIFSNPCNPTGRGLTAHEVLRFVRAVSCPVVVDEAYMEFWSESILDYLPGLPNAIVLRTCSKAFGLAAVRLGFAMASPPLAKLLDMARSPFNINTLTQIIGCTVLSDTAYLERCQAQLIEAAAYLKKGVDALAQRYPDLLRACPTVTNFALIDTPRAAQIQEKLHARSISIRLLGTHLLRITAGSVRENNALLSALEEILEEERAV